MMVELGLVKGLVALGTEGFRVLELDSCGGRLQGPFLVTGRR